MVLSTGVPPFPIVLIDILQIDNRYPTNRYPTLLIDILLYYDFLAADKLP